MNSTDINVNTVVKENVFFHKHWAIYEKMLAENYLDHQEIFHAIHQFIQNHFDKKNIELLDLAAGDARYMLGILANSPKIKTYVAVDNCALALDKAKANIMLLDVGSKFLEMNYSDFLTTNSKAYDLIIISLSFHHCTYEQKNHLFPYLRKSLKRDGCLIITDNIRKNHETRESFIQRWLLKKEAECTALSNKDMQCLRVHVSNFDYPETLKTMREIALLHGFEKVRSIYNVDDIHALVFT